MTTTITGNSPVLLRICKEVEQNSGSNKTKYRNHKRNSNQRARLKSSSYLTVPMDQRFDQLAAVQLVVVVRVVHLEVVELQLSLGHLARIDWHLHVFLDVTEIKGVRFGIRSN